MRKALLLFLLVVLLAPPAPKASALVQNPDGAAPPRSDGWRSSAGSDVPVLQDRGAAPQEQPAAPKTEPAIESEDDIFSTTYERELLSRRFFQKTLPPLNRRDKIIWAFRTARASVLL